MYLRSLPNYIALLASEVSGAAFSNRCDLLEQLSCMWEHGKKAAVIEGTESWA